MRKITRFDNFGFDVGHDLAGHATIAVRMAKLTYDNDGKLLAREPHRTELTPDSDMGLSDVQRSLKDMGFEPLPPEDIAKIKAIAELQWIPEVRQAHADKIEAIRKADAEKREAEKRAIAEAEASAEATRKRRAAEAGE
jgi:hypothetical protein